MFWLSVKNRVGAMTQGRLKFLMWNIFTPWVAIECGWFVAEYGRQPWVIDGILPTAYAASALSVTQLSISLAIYVTLYVTLFIIGTKVMLHAIRKGPDYYAPVIANSKPDTAAGRGVKPAVQH